MDAGSMQNPASKIINRRFLKKKSNSHLEWSRGNSYSFSKKAVVIKNRSLAALEPTSNRLLKKIFVSKGVMTDSNQNELQEKIKSLTLDKEDLAKKLESKRSQMIELNLKYLALKERWDYRRSNNENMSNISDFGDISNISTSEVNQTLNNTGLSRKNKAEQLAAIKARLQKINLKKIEQKSFQEEVLPKDI